MSLTYRISPSGGAPQVSSSGPASCGFDTLPNELIAAILAAAAPLCRDPTCLHVFDRVRFPVHIQLVCRRWRAVVLNIPALWAFLYIQRSRGTGCLQYLNRTGTLPLTVHLASASTHTIATSRHIKFIQTVHSFLADQAHRIQVLVIDGDDFSELPRSLKFPNVHDLSMNVGTMSLESFRTLSRLIVPWLRSLRVSAPRTPEWLPTYPDLQELRISKTGEKRVTTALFLAALDGRPNLRVVELANQRGSSSYRSSLYPRSRERFEHLEHLALRGFFMWEATQILGLMETPCLKKLVLAMDTWGDFRDPTPPDMSSWRIPELETLVLETLGWSLQIAKVFPYVKHLIFMGSPGEDTPEAVDRAFGDLHHFWRSLRSPLPLETLQTRGVRLSSLLALFPNDGRGLLPSLHTISVHYTDTVVSKGPAEFQQLETEWIELSKLVVMKTYGLIGEVLSVRSEVIPLEYGKGYKTVC